MGNHYPFETGGFQLVIGVVTGIVGRTWPFWEDSLLSRLAVTLVCKGGFIIIIIIIIIIILIEMPLQGSSDMNQIQPFQMEFNQQQQGILQFDFFPTTPKTQPFQPNSGFSSSLGPATVAHIATFLKDTSMVAAFLFLWWSRYAFFPFECIVFSKKWGRQNLTNKKFTESSALFQQLFRSIPTGYW